MTTSFRQVSRKRSVVGPAHPFPNSTRGWARISSARFNPLASTLLLLFLTAQLQQPIAAQQEITFSVLWWPIQFKHGTFGAGGVPETSSLWVLVSVAVPQLHLPLLSQPLDTKCFH